MIPPDVLAEARETASTRSVEGSAGKVGAAIIIFFWMLFFVAAAYLVLRYVKRI
jgi:hypothetical protein